MFSPNVLEILEVLGMSESDFEPLRALAVERGSDPDLLVLSLVHFVINVAESRDPEDAAEALEEAARGFQLPTSRLVEAVVRLTPEARTRLQQLIRSEESELPDPVVELSD